MEKPRQSQARSIDVGGRDGIRNGRRFIRYLYVYVIVTGASVMALELAASRFLAPYFGTSMIVWANVIGLILLALSVGYVVGGRVADRWPRVRLLMWLSLTAGMWMATLPLWGQVIFRGLAQGILNTPMTTIILSFIAILLVFAPPVFLLAMVSPFAIRLASGAARFGAPQSGVNHSGNLPHGVSVSSVKAADTGPVGGGASGERQAAHAPTLDIGRVAGNLYAFSTLGSLIGTFGTAFLTIPFFGVRETIFFWAAVLVAASLWGLVQADWLRIGAALGLVLVLPPLASGALPGPTSPYGKVLWSKDTLYQHVAVVRETDGSTALIYNEGGGVQSLRRPGDALNPGDYYDDYLALPYLRQRASRVVVLGSAGGTIPHLLAKYVRPERPDLRVTGVEIDGDVIPLDFRYFGVRPGDARFVNQDARVFVQQAPAHAYDIAIVDAYTNQIYIPYELTTVEFFRELKRRLTPGGLVAMNVNATSTHSRLLLSMEKTLRVVFPYVYRIKARGMYNYIVLASDEPVSTAGLRNVRSGSPLAQVAADWPQRLGPVTARDVAGGMVLTDDRAPVEMLTDSMIFGAARER
ncbi:spermidine synthase [Alicyclobacillus herbarius]|uniref:spermidine synthase n=1 Tax=Alicyclobacillus herbarius TaxID=122960 RepID=UPI00047EAC3F|nr:fused MFS/spermidine synthase [Alicyclobacillus herbarius]